MKYINIGLLCCFFCQVSAAKLPQVKSVGSLTFFFNGQLYEADSIHARGYAVKQTSAAYVNGANSDNMIANMEWKEVKAAGTFFINSKSGKAEFAINHKSYSIKQTDDYLKIVISHVKQQGPFLLLSGTFEGQLQDKNGNKVKITNGRFETKSI
jgi:hypothetical protein